MSLRQQSWQFQLVELALGFLSQFSVAYDFICE
jgi:hypothetical protein